MVARVLRSVETRAGDANGVGSIRWKTWKSALPYKLEFDSEIVRIERHKLIEARAFGELDGGCGNLRRSPPTEPAFNTIGS